MLRRLIILFTIFLIGILPIGSYAQTEIDSILIQRRIDSLLEKKRQDSIKLAEKIRIGDSISKVYLIPVGPYKNKFVDSLLKTESDRFTYGFFSAKGPLKVKKTLGEGKIRKKSETWIIGVLLILLTFFIILKQVFGGVIKMIVQSFYSSRVLNQISHEENIINSWPFMLLFILFGLTTGLYLYLSSHTINILNTYSGFSLFIALSLGLAILFFLKIIILRIIGFVFNITTAIKEYIAVAYLSYFNTSLVLLPFILLIAFSATDVQHYLIILSLIVLAAVFLFQYFKGALMILSHFNFPKLYLILYLCALEICPVIVLIKIFKF